MSIEYSKLPNNTECYQEDESGNCIKIRFAYQGEKNGAVTVKDDVFDADPQKPFDNYTEEELDAMYDDAIAIGLKTRVDQTLAEV